MTSSLVGSEMCIRDSKNPFLPLQDVRPLEPGFKARTCTSALYNFPFSAGILGGKATTSQQGLVYRRPSAR
eukprot:10228821-Prorocentrum_lima.AAC.1